MICLQQFILLIYKVESVPWIFLTTFNIYRMQPLLHRSRKHGTHQAVIAAKRRLQSTTSSDPCNINMVNVYVCYYLWRFPRSNLEQTTCIEFIFINSFLVWFFLIACDGFLPISCTMNFICFDACGKKFEFFISS